ncbi:hypothetical protein [Mesorhizobium sp. A623]
MNIKIYKIGFRPDADWSRKAPVIAEADAAVPALGVTFKGVQLAWNWSRKSFVAYPPGRVGNAIGVDWTVTGEFARAMAEAMGAAYVTVGGKVPEHRRGHEGKGEPVRLDHVTGKPIGPDPLDEIGHRTFPATWTVEPADVADDHEAAEGLHRTLGVDAIAETMERAGL